ncbi:MAG: hypothetical protein O7F75_05975, partial [Alphaproteobacteria bacterium]|nr:hypothetical protein [Alphaproteobacteria bacterium]
AVTRVLKRHGFKAEELLERYKRDGDVTRSFALRKDRATCWANLESEGEPVAPAAPKKPLLKTPAKIPAPVWRLTVDCFRG